MPVAEVPCCGESCRAHLQLDHCKEQLKIGAQARVRGVDKLLPIP